MSDITKFDYDGEQISFEFADGNKMINATEMAKPFGKLVGGFLRSKTTKDFILLLEKRYADLHNGQREVLRVFKGGCKTTRYLDGRKTGPEICGLA